LRQQRLPKVSRASFSVDNNSGIIKAGAIREDEHPAQWPLARPRFPLVRSFDEMILPAGMH
jgi:hypothetical protein